MQYMFRLKLLLMAKRVSSPSHYIVRLPLYADWTVTRIHFDFNMTLAQLRERAR